jgi:ribosomal protein L16 Arg81 hydroxylase
MSTGKKKTLVVRRNAPDFYRDYVSVAKVDRLLEVALLAQGRVLEIAAAPESKRRSKMLVPRHHPRDRVYNSFVDGDTVRLIGVEQFDNALSRLNRKTEEVLSAKSGINLFLTPRQSQGFHLHFDLLDVFALQVEGRKRWQIWEPKYQHPLQSEVFQEGLEFDIDREALVPFDDVVLDAGDMLYMPRGYYHEVTTLDDLSLHVTLTVEPTHWGRLLHRAVEIMLAQDSRLRESLPLGFVRDDSAHEEMKQRFGALLDSFAHEASFERSLESLREDWVRSRTYPADGHFATLSRLDELSPDSVVERRCGLTCRVQIQGNRATVRFGSNQVTGPAAIAPMVETLRDGGRHRITDLPGILDLDSKTKLVRRLIREGLLTVTEF